MNLVKRWLTKHKHKEQSNERSLVLIELEKAKNEWDRARERLNYVLEKDQIDYAIYAFQAAERHYNMLIKKAKAMHLNRLEDERNEGSDG